MGTVFLDDAIHGIYCLNVPGQCRQQDEEAFDAPPRSTETAV